MIKMKSAYCPFVVVLVFLWLSACSNDSGSQAASVDWLTGKWELTFDPDANETDWLVFREDGTASVETPDGRKIPCKCNISENVVVLTFKIKGRSFDNRLSVSEEKSRLTNDSGAYYTKL